MAAGDSRAKRGYQTRNTRLSFALPQSAKAFLFMEFGSRWLSRSMPKVKNFDHVLVVIEAVVNQERTMQQFSNSGPSADDVAHARKVGE